MHGLIHQDGCGVRSNQVLHTHGFQKGKDWQYFRIAISTCKQDICKARHLNTAAQWFFAKVYF